MTTPPPGSDEAFAIGCTCPRMDNGHGRGAGPSTNGNPMFWQSADCPIHAGKTVATVEHHWDHDAGGPVKIVRPVEDDAA